MFGINLDTVLFVSTLLLFLLGALSGVSIRQKPEKANFISHAFSFFGGIIGVICALRVLLWQKSVAFTAWPIVFDIELAFKIDALSAFFLLIICSLAAVVSVYSTGYVTEYYHKKNVGLLGGGLNLFLLSMIAVVTVDNGFSFLIAWELMSLVSFFLVMYEHEKQEVRQAGYIYLIMTHFGTIFITLSFLSLFLFAGSFNFADFHNISSTLPLWLKNAIFIMAFIGFGTKAGIVPLHTWLPKAHPAAPSHVSALMSAVMIKTAVYGLIRVSFDFLGGGSFLWGALLILSGLGSAFIGIFHGLAENDVKRFLAYSSSENMGIIFIGVGAALVFDAYQSPLLAALALTAALYHTLNHAIFKGLLFMGAGAVIFATHTKNINELGGLIKRMPVTAALFLIGGLSLCALPPFNGFISEWATFQSLLHIAFDIYHPLWKVAGILAAASLGLIGALVAGGFIKQFGTAFLAMPRSEHAAHAKEVPVSMRAAMAVLAVFTFIFGIYPAFFLKLVQNVNDAIFQAYLARDTIYVPYYIMSKTEMIFPVVIFSALVVIFILSIALLRFWFGKSRVLTDETWNCGTSIEPSMQYSGTSFSHPLLMILKPLIGFERKVKAHEPYAYHLKKIEHRLNTYSLTETKIYVPLVHLAVKLSQRIRLLQSGSLQSYLAYMVVTLIIALLFIRQV